MKKFLFIIFAGVVAMGLTTSLDSCKKQTTGDSANSSAEVSSNEENANCEVTPDSIVKDDKLGKFSVSLDVPNDVNSPLGKAICGFFKEQMFDEENPYNGDSTQVKTMMNGYITNNEAVAKKAVAEGYNNPDAPYENSVDIHKIAEEAKWVTFESTTSIYLGGAHGGASVMGATFIKDSGKKITWNDFDTKAAGFHQLIIDGLKRNFEVKSDSELQNFLLDVSIKEVEVPKACPYFTKDGVRFVYQQYEICSYADGMPEFTIPYDQIAQYMKPEIKALMK